MLYFAHTNNPLSPFKGGQRQLVHLVSHVDVIGEVGYQFAITDRNAALGYARQSDDLGELDQLIDWTLQDQTYWNNTPHEPDRMERRMAEFLVHSECGIEALLGLVVSTRMLRGAFLTHSANTIIPRFGSIEPGTTEVTHGHQGGNWQPVED